MWIDSHAHLYNKSVKELSETISHARENNVDTVINTGTNLDTSEIVLKQATQSDFLLSAVGISPFDVITLPEDWIAILKSQMEHTLVVAAGEMGIDDSNPRYPSVDSQIPVFEQQLALAKEYDLPAIIHSRGAEERCVDFCVNQNIEKAVFHCFTGDSTVLKKALEQGYYISFSGIITFKNNPLEEVVRNTPLSQLLIETDTPYLAPHPLRGKTNEPAFVSYIGEKVAKIHNKELPEVASIIKENFSRLFNISISEN